MGSCTLGLAFAVGMEGGHAISGGPACVPVGHYSGTVFFLMESMNVEIHWKALMNFGALVILVAPAHTSICAMLGADWCIPDRVSLRRLVKHSAFADGEFYLILFACHLSIGLFVFGAFELHHCYVGLRLTERAGILNAWTGFRCRHIWPAFHLV